MKQKIWQYPIGVNIYKRVLDREDNVYWYKLIGKIWSEVTGAECMQLENHHRRVTGEGYNGNFIKRINL